MTILVLSDSHSTLRFMRQCVQAVKPNALIHLGDYFDDGVTLAEEFPEIHFIRCRVTVTVTAARRVSRKSLLTISAACGCT